MKKILLSLICLAPIMASANEYKTDLQVFTSNTAKKRCATAPQLIYKGDRAGYAKSMSKMGDQADYAALTAIAGGLAVGAIVFSVTSLASAATGDYEYLYVTECNGGANKTRLMTLVVSNNSLSEAQWVATAKRDQARSR